MKKRGIKMRYEFDDLEEYCNMIKESEIKNVAIKAGVFKIGDGQAGYITIFTAIKRTMAGEDYFIHTSTLTTGYPAQSKEIEEAAQPQLKAMVDKFKTICLGVKLFQGRISIDKTEG